MKRGHLPILGLGPLIVIPQLVLAAISIRIGVFESQLEVGWVLSLKIPFTILGAAMIVCGIMLWYQANFKVKIDKHIEANSLVTTGGYTPMCEIPYIVHFYCPLLVLFCQWLMLLCWSCLLFAGYI